MTERSSDAQAGIMGLSTKQENKSLAWRLELFLRKFYRTMSFLMLLSGICFIWYQAGRSSNIPGRITFALEQFTRSADTLTQAINFLSERMDGQQMYNREFHLMLEKNDSVFSKRLDLFSIRLNKLNNKMNKFHKSSKGGEPMPIPAKSNLKMREWLLYKEEGE